MASPLTAADGQLAGADRLTGTAALLRPSGCHGRGTADAVADGCQGAANAARPRLAYLTPGFTASCMTAARAGSHSPHE